MVGFCAGPLALLIASLATGTFSTLWDEALGLLLIAAAAGVSWLLLLGFAVEHARREGGQRSPFPLACGSLLTLIGVLLLLSNVWIEPAVQAEPNMQKLADAFGATTGAPDAVSLGLVALGLVVLVKPAHTLLFARR
jgi:hypothetical protein